MEEDRWVRENRGETPIIYTCEPMTSGCDCVLLMLSPPENAINSKELMLRFSRLAFSVSMSRSNRVESAIFLRVFTCRAVN